MEILLHFFLKTRPSTAPMSDTIEKSLYFLLQRASEQFSVLKQQGGGANTREETLKKLAAAFDGYQELSAHLQVTCNI